MLCPVHTASCAYIYFLDVRQGVQSCKEEQKMVEDEKYKMKNRPKGTVGTVEGQEENKMWLCHIWQYLWSSLSENGDFLKIAKRKVKHRIPVWAYKNVRFSLNVSNSTIYLMSQMRQIQRQWELQMRVHRYLLRWRRLHRVLTGKDTSPSQKRLTEVLPRAGSESTVNSRVRQEIMPGRDGYSGGNPKQTSTLCLVRFPVFISSLDGQFSVVHKRNINLNTTKDDYSMLWYVIPPPQLWTSVAMILEIRIKLLPICLPPTSKKLNLLKSVTDKCENRSCGSVVVMQF